MFFFLLTRRPSKPTRTDTLLPYTTPFRSPTATAMTPTSSSSSGRRSPDLGDEPFFLVLHRTPGRVSCFLSDRAPRRDLTGPARPAGLRDRKSKRLNSSH